MLYRQIGDVPLSVWDDEMSRYPDSPLIPKAPAIYSITKGHTAIAMMHLKRESEFETKRNLLDPSDNNPFNLRPNHLFPAEGVTGEKNGYLTFDSVESAAREWRRRVIDDPDYYRLLPDGTKARYTPDMTLEQYINAYAPVGDAHETTGDANETYYKDAVTILTRILAKKEEQPVAKEYKVMTTDAEFIMVESEIPIVVALLPKSQKNQRPGYAMQAVYWVQHENGNPNHQADDELRYFRQGAEGRQASYHFVGDESVIYQMVPTKENTWQAGDNLGPGNMKSISGSIAQGAASFTKARQGMAFFAGRLMRKVGIARNNSRRHIDFMRKNCPQWINDGGLWPAHKAQIEAAWDGGGTTPLPQPTYPKPIQIAALDMAGLAPAMVTLTDGTECIYVGDRVRAVRETKRLQWAGTTAPEIGPKVAKGEEFNVDWLLKNKEGWWYYTPYDSRIDYDDVERVSDTKL